MRRARPIRGAALPENGESGAASSNSASAVRRRRSRQTVRSSSVTSRLAARSSASKNGTSVCSHRFSRTLERSSASSRTVAPGLNSAARTALRSRLATRSAARTRRVASSSKRCFAAASGAARQRHFAFNKGAGLHIVHIVPGGDQPPLVTAGIAHPVPAPSADCVCWQAQTVCALQHEAEPVSVADAAGLRVDWQILTARLLTHNAASTGGHGPTQRSLDRAAAGARTRPGPCPACRSGRRDRPDPRPKNPAGCGAACPTSIAAGGHFCGVTTRAPSEVMVGASHGKTRGRSAAGGEVPHGTLAHKRCQIDVSLGGRTSVVNGPPPRSPVRLPAPPAGAQDWKVNSVIAAAARPRLAMRPRWTSRSVLLRVVLAPGVSISRRSMGSASEASSSKSCRKRGPSPSRAKACAIGAKAASNVAGSGGSSHSSSHASGSRGGQAVARRPISNSSVATRKSARGQSMAMTGSSAASRDLRWAYCIASGMQPPNRQPRIGYKIEHEQAARFACL